MMRRFPNDIAIGDYIASGIAEVVSRKPDALICIAAGTSSFPVFDALIRRVRAGTLSFAKASFIGMDEWVGLPQDADGAMADFLRRHFLQHVDFADSFLLDGAADPQAECRRMETYLSAHGGADVIVFGIGVNGHVALNEPGVDPLLRSHIADVAPLTANVAQKYFASAAPELRQGVTLGLANAAEAGKLYVMANTAVKRTAVEQIISLVESGSPSNEVPASLVAALPQAELCVTEDVFAG